MFVRLIFLSQHPATKQLMHYAELLDDAAMLVLSIVHCF